MPSSAERPPIAGRPPFATDYDDKYYGEQPASTRRMKPPPPQRYEVESHYSDNDQDNRNSGIGGIGMGLMNVNMDDDDSDDDRPQPKQGANLAREQSERNKALFAAATSPPPQPHSVLAAAPKQPGPHAGSRGGIDHHSPQPKGPAPPAYQSNGRNPPPGLQPGLVQPSPRQPPGLRADLKVDTEKRGTPSPGPPMAHPIPRAPMPAFMQPPPSPAPSNAPSFNPHPLNAPSTPITPVFARPSFHTESKEIKFSSDAILRGNSEETLLARNTAKGEEFWRRFSFVAKEQPKNPKSNWLRRTQGGSTRMSRWIWCISIFLLLCIGGGIGAGVYFTQDSPDTLPVAIGGSENRTAGPESTTEQAAATTGRPSLVAPPAIETKRALSPELDLWARAAEVDNGSVVKRHMESHRKLRRNRIAVGDLD